LFLDQLLRHNHAMHRVIFCSAEAFMLHVPPVKFFEEYSFMLHTSDILAPYDLAQKLVQHGYTSSITTEEPGTFAKKGEIFDIFPTSGSPVRIHYFDDMIEEIFLIDVETQKTLRKDPLDNVRIPPAPHIFTGGKFSNNLRSKIPMPAPQFKNKYEARKDLFGNLSDGNLFDNYPAYTPLFFKNTSFLIDFLDPKSTMCHFVEASETLQNSLEYLEVLREEHETEKNDITSDCLLPGPENFYHHNILELTKNFKKININKLDIELNLNNGLEKAQPLNLENARVYFGHSLGKKVTFLHDKKEYIKEVLCFIKEEFKKNGQVIITYKNEHSKKQIDYLLNLYEFSSVTLRNINFVEFDLDEGFYYPSEQLLILSDSDLFSSKSTKVKKVSSKKVDLFAQQLATLKAGDYVVHQDLGIGLYQGLQSLEIGDDESDFLVLLFEGNDKVYVPVYKMNLIQKHADGSQKVALSNLRSRKFNLAKARAKQAAKNLAFDLIRLQAERKSSKAHAFSPADLTFKEFELAFPFAETPDQLRAINDVMDDMERALPMDRLVCGDVGFGKTEVAIRAAFKAVLDKKQVAVLVPTTILALQHFNTFTKRLEDFPVNINYLSRFKTAKESKKIIQELSEGRIDIIIGTHKILSDKIKFADLGLVIVDEEQRFGVGHKEKFKLLKSSVDYLTLTATPIPRTLQLSFLGIRDLSLIQTAPPKRQSIKTYLIKEDDQTIKSAIEKEIARGGQVFYVHNRVQDIEQRSRYLRELVPDAKILVAHGQLPERDLEKRMNDFYNGKFNVLISTTIIESGLDIPSVNTMIVNRTDTFGLSQLHQLRGRIGRSDKKAYAYFVIPKGKRISDLAQKRLQALQTYVDLGSGFAMATSDMEIRGAGDILGAEQSGHIDTIGLELYMQLLQEAVSELKGEKNTKVHNIEIQIPEPAYIPTAYISEPSQRLMYYKKLSNCGSLTDLSELKEEIFDLFGAGGTEIQNLYCVLEIRAILQNIGLTSLKVVGHKAHLKFDQTTLKNNPQLRDNITNFFLQRPKVYKITPDFRVIYSHKTPIDQKQLLEFSKHIAEQIVPC